MSDPAADTPPAPVCPRCGQPVAPGQDWCLNCGAAVTTHVAGAPGWRAPLVIAAAVLTLAAAGLVVAFFALSDDDTTTSVAQTPPPAATTAPLTGPTGAAGTATPTPTVTANGPTGPTGPGGVDEPGEEAATSATPTPATGDFPDWPANTTAYTVIVYSGTTRAAAVAKAKSVPGLSDLGILRSNRYSSLRSGYWVVFSGQYDTIKAATDAAEAAQPTAPGAYPKQVKP